MNQTMNIIFFEDYFTCSILPNESAWEALQVNGSEKTGLCFYVSDGAVRNDEFAKERFLAEDPQAFGRFYELVSEGKKKFRRFDSDLDVIHLLKDALEQVKLAYTERMKCFAGTLDKAAAIPVNICFIPGIGKNARSIILDYLAAEGFHICYEADYFAAWMKILQVKSILPAKAELSVVEAYFGDLSFHYIEYRDAILKKEQETLGGKGVDHRIGNLARLMVDKAAKQTMSRIRYDKVLLEQEIKRFHARAEKEMHNFAYGELEVKIELSDFSAARIRITQQELDNLSVEFFNLVQYKYESFISKNSSLARNEKILLSGALFSAESVVVFFQKLYGIGKVIKPPANFVELLSRGMAAIVPPPLPVILKPIAPPPSPPGKILPQQKSMPPPLPPKRPPKTKSETKLPPLPAPPRPALPPLPPKKK